MAKPKRWSPATRHKVERHLRLPTNTKLSEIARQIRQRRPGLPGNKYEVIIAFAKLLPPQPLPESAPRAAIPPEARSAFLYTFEWRKLRMVVLLERGTRCECCGAAPADGVRVNVDHIKPRKLYPELALEKSNLQVLCADCNHGKGNWDETDWRNRSLR